jgi:hypothetical protein
VNLGFKLKTEQLEIVEMFWQVFSHWISALTSRRAWIQTHARVGISLHNTVAIPDQFENTDFDKLCILLNTCRFMYL